MNVVSPPDTAGVEKFLDQINQKLYLEYKTTTEGLFTLWWVNNKL